MNLWKIFWGNLQILKLFVRLSLEFYNLAERGGFEPPIRLTVCRISNPVHSTALPSLRYIANIINMNTRSSSNEAYKTQPRVYSRGQFIKRFVIKSSRDYNRGSKSKHAHDKRCAPIQNSLTYTSAGCSLLRSEKFSNNFIF